MLACSHLQASCRTLACRRFFSTAAVFFPYGESNFRSIRRSGQFFGDFSEHIPSLEAIGKQLIFTRPPRWGKTLLQDMLRHYYDKNTTDEEFRELFGELDICERAEGPTDLAQKFHVLPLDLGVSVEDPTRIEQNMFNKINVSINKFARRYDLDIQIFENDANASLNSLASAVELQNGQLYLLIDEYDRFANKLMFENPEQYHRLVGTPGSSPLRSFLETVKEVKPARTFITGITTIALADASGANSFKNVSLQRQLGTMVGFTEDIVRRGLDTLQLTDMQLKSAMRLMHSFFNGYLFPGDDVPLFNSQQCLYFLQEVASGNFLYLLENDTWEKMEPCELIDLITDPNTRISDNVFGVLGNTPISRADIVALASSPVSCPVASLSSSFRLAEMLEPPTDAPHQLLARSRAFMFSHGMVTLAPGSQNNRCELIVPNEIARQDYLKKLDKKLGLRDFDIGCIFADPSAENVRQFLQSIINQIHTQHDANYSEGALQAALESWLKAMQLMAPRFTVVVEARHDKTGDKTGYSDLLLIDPVHKVIVLIELERIRLQHLRDEQGQRVFSFKELNRWNLAASEEHINKMELTQLLALRSQKKDVSPTIRENLDRKKKQVAGYEDSLRSTGFATVRNERVETQGMDIYSLAVVQVGRRVVVEDNKDVV